MTTEYTIPLSRASEGNFRATHLHIKANRYHTDPAGGAFKLYEVDAVDAGGNKRSLALLKDQADHLRECEKNAERNYVFINEPKTFYDIDKMIKKDLSDVEKVSLAQIYEDPNSVTAIGLKNQLVLLRALKDVLRNAGQCIDWE